MWHTLPVVGQVVRLNPAHDDYSEYNRRQARGDLGVIIRRHNDVDTIAEIRRKIKGVSGASLDVQWQNGHRNTYRDTALLPINGVFLDFRVIANYPYTTEVDKRRAEYGIFVEGSTRYSKVNKQNRTYRQSEILDTCNRWETSTEKDATIIANLMYNTKLQLDAEEHIIPTDTFFSRAEYLFNKEEEGNLSSEDMRGLRDVNTFVMEAQLIADSEELALLYKRELPVADTSFTENTSPTMDVGETTQVADTDDTLRRADESYGDWINRMVLGGIVVTEEMMNNAQNPRPVRRRAGPRATPPTRTTVDDAFQAMLAGDTLPQAQPRPVRADGGERDPTQDADFLPFSD